MITRTRQDVGDLAVRVAVEGQPDVAAGHLDVAGVLVACQEAGDQQHRLAVAAGQVDTAPDRVGE